MVIHADEPVRTCYECKGSAEWNRENYKYSECGLKYIVLRDVAVYRCKACGSVSVKIPNIEGLHRTIALNVMCKRSLLSADEIKFLRKAAGLSATGLARSLCVTKNAVSRWENKGKAGARSDKSIRITCGLLIIQEILAETQASVQQKSLDRAMKQISKFLGEFDVRATVDEILKESEDSDKLFIDPEFPNFSALAGHLAEASIQ